MAAKLFEAASIGKLSIKNRLVMPPMLMGYGSADGYVTQRMLDYFEERAKGGVGMVIVEAVGIRFEGKVYPYFINCYDDTHLPGLTTLADVIKRHGARAAIQIADGGRNTRPDMTGEQPIAPSPIATFKRDQPRVLTTEEVRGFVRRFAASISLAKKAGFDGVEIHAAHVYLLNQFLSAASNIRTDAYGGSLEKRARILVEIVEEARKLVGDEFPIWVRINAEETGEENGITVDQAAQIAMIAERAGYDAISVSSGGSHYESTIASMYFDPGYLVPAAHRIRQAVTIPVIAVGRIDARLAEQVIAEGKADFVAIGRGLMVDPELPRKAQQGRYSDIAPCLSCLNCVHRGVLRDTPITCSVNPALGRESELRLTPAAVVRHVAVVGGGPAGLEAARVAASRGHRVTLIHDGDKLGGQFRLAGAAPRKESFLAWLDYMTLQLARHEVCVRLGTEASANLIAELEPDVLLVASGPLGAPCRGAVSAPAGRIIRLQDALAGRAEIGATVAIFGEDAMAAETADLLSEQGKTVTLVSPGRKIAPAMLNLIRSMLLARLSDKKVLQLTNMQLGAISGAEVEIVAVDGQRRTIGADTVILGNEYRADTGFLSSVRDKVPALYLIGGCRLIGDQQDAIADGYKVARLI